jgi:HAD superfamily hydrolase (TIGR01509 family)
MCLKLKGIVMDMDGTITRFNLDYMTARRISLKELERMNLRTPEMTEQVPLYLMLKKVKDNVDPETFARVRGIFYKFFEEMELKAAREAAVYPGAVETLRKLRNRGLKIGLVTNNGRVGTELTLKRCQIEGFFDTVVTRDDCEEVKPNGAPVRKVLDDMQVIPEEAILVGDSAMDIIAAKAVGLPSVAVATGPFTSERLLQAEPDYLLGSVNDLPLLIEKLDPTND